MLATLAASSLLAASPTPLDSGTASAPAISKLAKVQEAATVIWSGGSSTTREMLSRLDEAGVPGGSRSILDLSRAGLRRAEVAVLPGTPNGLATTYTRDRERWTIQHWQSVEFDTAPSSSEQVAWIVINSFDRPDGSLTAWRAEGSSYILLGPGPAERGLEIARHALEKYASFE